MLKQLTLKNWKSFRQADLYIDPLTVLIGTNASGKSNIVDALDFLNRISQGIALETSLVGDSNIPGIRGGSEWAARKPGTQFTLGALISDTDDNFEYSYHITVATNLKVRLIDESLAKSNPYQNPTHIPKVAQRLVSSIKNQGIISINNSEYSSQDLEKIFPNSLILLGNMLDLPFYGFDSASSMLKGQTLVIDEFKKITIINPIPELMRNYSPLSKNLERDGSNIAGVLAALPEPDKQKIEATLLTYLTQLPEGDLQRVWAEPVGRLGSDAMLYCEEKWVKNQSPTLIDARGMSDGTLRFLAILTAMLTRPEGSLIVIEEVDNGLHPSRAGLLLKMLREIGEQRTIDVLVTTHNPALLDELTPDYIPFILVAYRDQETGESQLIPLEDIENLPKIMSSGSLGEVAQAGLIEKSLRAKQK